MSVKKISRHGYSSLFFKYLVSYIVILTISVIAVTGIMRGSFVNMFDKQLITDNLNTLNRLMYVIDNQLSQMQKTALQIEINKNLRPVNLNDNPTKVFTVKNELANYVATNNFIENIFLYYRNDEYIYSSFGSCSTTMFIDDVYNYGSWNKITFYEDINSISSNTVYYSNNAAGKQNRNFIFLYPLPANSMHPYATSLFIVPEKSFKNIMKSTLKDWTENTIILDNDNRIITSINDNEYIYTEEFSKAVETLGNSRKVKNLNIDGKKYLLFSIYSDNTSWRYISIVPIYKTREEISNMQMKLIYSIILVWVFVGIIAYFISRLNYRPIKNLDAYAKMIWSGNKEGLNEVETVKETLKFLSDKNIQLDQKLKSEEIARKEHLLTKILKGEIGTVYEVNQKGRDIGVIFTKDNYRVSMLKFSYGSDILCNIKGNVIKFIEESLPNQCEAYIRDHIDGDKASLIISYAQEDEKNILKALDQIKGSIKEKWNIVLTIGVGGEYNSIHDIPKSYIEACTALDFRFVKGNSTIIFYEEMTKEQSNCNSYPHEDIAKLEVFIKQGDTDNIETILGRLIDFIKDQDTPIFIARRICYDIINIVMRTMNEIYKEFAFVNAKYPDVFALREFETVDQFVDIIKIICYDICNYVKENQYKQCEQMLRNILDYIDENYTHCNFSIQNMADRFNMSTSGISQYFKDQTGQNILDYVSYLKIEKAKKLLMETGIPVKDVCKDIGYYNVSSFIRRFKQMTGLTPGEYRKNNVI